MSDRRKGRGSDGEHRRGASWVDERKDERGNMRVMQGFSKLRTDSAYEQAEQCDDCVGERAEQDDESALCERHLAQAMGMDSEWP